MYCGLLGRKLGHSYSPQIHRELGSYSYHLFEKEPEELEAFLKTGDFTGLNVTIPYKKTVIPYCSQLTEKAKKLGCVNTLIRQRDGTLLGHNTDHFGFETLLRRSGLTVTGKKVLVLGSGGASNTAAAVLQKQGARVIIISRSGEENYENLERHKDAAVIVNTTPVGMYPDTCKAPLDLALFPNLEGVLDVIYNPARTELLLQARKRGIVAQNGLMMLVAQAKEAAEWFTGSQIPDASIDAIHQKLRMQMENIILIGMPGCGKSTTGKLLADKLGKSFVDADAALEEAAGRSIPQIFATDGEPLFRQLETQTLSQLGKQSGLVIATGGGCVTRPHNYPLLHQNGQIFWLTRDLEKLPTDGRPLSQSNRLSDLAAQRRPLYEAFADFQIDNNGTLDSTVNAILAHWEEHL